MKKEKAVKTGQAFVEDVISIDGTECAELHPVIVSVSRRTDVPAFYMDEFLRVWRRGYVFWQNPYNPTQIKKVCFNAVKLVVFWSKYPAGLLKRLKKIDIDFLLFYTVNDYPNIVEPGMPSIEVRLNLFKELSRLLGKERILWRFDPILLIKEKLEKEELLKRVERIAKELSGYTNRMIVSFVTPYRKVLARFKNAGVELIDFDRFTELVDEIAAGIGEIGRRYGFEVQTCAERFNVFGRLERFGLKKGACVDKGYIMQVFASNEELVESVRHLKKDKGQRSICGCVESVDIGRYGTCRFKCLYCYAR